jgi:hypothetical protein
MATGTVATTARKYHEDMVHYVSAPISGADGAPQTFTVGVIPAGAAVIEAGAVITTAFDGTTPVVDIGYSGALEAFASDVALGVLGTVSEKPGTPYVTADQTVVATTATGSTVTAGAGYAFVTYIMANRAAG